MTSEDFESLKRGKAQADALRRLKPFDPTKYLTPADLLDLLGEAYDENDRLKSELDKYGFDIFTGPTPAQAPKE